MDTEKLTPKFYLTEAHVWVQSELHSVHETFTYCWAGF